MRTIVGLMFVFMLMIVAAPAYAAGVVQIYNCEQDEDATDGAIKALAAEWLKAAKKMKGGERLEVYIRHPIVGLMGEKDFTFVLRAPSLEEWALFTSGYEGSELEIIDDKLDELCDCPGSTLWEIQKLE
ncbi:MAG: hypothetical protein PVJ56_08290 [Desulfobacterales bacterium]